MNHEEFTALLKKAEEQRQTAFDLGDAIRRIVAVIPRKLIPKEVIAILEKYGLI